MMAQNLEGRCRVPSILDIEEKCSFPICFNVRFFQCIRGLFGLDLSEDDNVPLVQIVEVQV